jgi:hypothetical protein
MKSKYPEVTACDGRPLVDGWYHGRVSGHYQIKYKDLNERYRVDIAVDEGPEGPMEAQLAIRFAEGRSWARIPSGPSTELNSPLLIYCVQLSDGKCYMQRWLGCDSAQGAALTKPLEKHTPPPTKPEGHAF